jgi:hypothetical protein
MAGAVDKVDGMQARLDKLGQSIPTPGMIPGWERDDIYSIHHGQEANIKLGIATLLQCQYDTVGEGVLPTADTVDHIAPYTPEIIKNGHKHFWDIGKNAKTAATMLTAEKAREDNGSVSTVINANMIDWLPPGKQYDVGYIGQFHEEKLPEWNIHIERTAGGLQSEVKYNAQHLAVTNMSSLMAMISEVVYQYMAVGHISPQMTKAYTSVRVLLLYGASRDDISTIINETENYEQEKRKRTCEPDCISVVNQWHANMLTASGGKLTPDSALNYLKYAVTLGDPRKPTNPQLAELLQKQKLPPTMKNKMKVLTTPECSAKYMMFNKFMTGHPLMNSYQAIALRVRFKKGFADEAIDQVFEFKKEWGKRGWADRPLPLTRKPGQTIISRQ